MSMDTMLADMRLAIVPANMRGLNRRSRKKSDQE